MADEWHYSSNGRKSGPVSPADLRRLAATGGLAPTDLVWRQGMQQWVPASAVKGLFAAPPQPDPLPATRPPVRRQSPANRPDGWHPLDAVIETVREACPDHLAETIAAGAGRTGIATLYASATLTLIGGVLLAIRGNSFGAFAAGLGVTIGVLVGQYIAYRLLGACRTAITANRSILSSLAIPDSAFVLISVATIAGTIGLTWMAISERRLVFFFAALVALVVGAFASLTAVTPGGLGLDVDPKCRAAQEAVGVLTFLVKLFLRCTPLLFAAGVAFATFRLIDISFRVMTAGGEQLFFLQRDVGITVASLFAVIAVPVYAYVLMLLYYLTLDVIAAIVSLPGKLDLIAGRNDEAGGA